MQINVAQLLKEPTGAKRNYKIDELAGENSDNRIVGEVNLTRTNRGVLVLGTLSTDIKGTCCRCLSTATTHITFNMEDEYFPVVEINSGIHLQTGRDDFIIDDNHVIDLDEAIRQYIIMATPMKQLCRPDCQGLCPECGQEIFKGSCRHRSKSYDRRWDRLSTVRKGEQSINGTTP